MPPLAVVGPGVPVCRGFLNCVAMLGAMLSCYTLFLSLRLLIRSGKKGRQILCATFICRFCHVDFFDIRYCPHVRNVADGGGLMVSARKKRKRAS